MSGGVIHPFFIFCLEIWHEISDFRCKFSPRCYNETNRHAAEMNYMTKKLSEMTLEELWQLFPIFLTEHQNRWKEWYQNEEKILKSILPQNQTKRISHIGSSAIDTIWAKPIIDILVEVSVGCNMENIKTLLVNNGYICMNQSENRMSFNKGYMENGFAEKVYHLHLRYEGDNDELYFRDYLIEHPEIAREYEKLKLDLWKKYEHDRDGYTNAKIEFVSLHTKNAKELYKEKIWN